MMWMCGRRREIDGDIGVVLVFVQVGELVACLDFGGIGSRNRRLGLLLLLLRLRCWFWMRRWRMKGGVLRKAW